MPIEKDGPFNPEAEISDEYSELQNLTTGERETVRVLFEEVRSLEGILDMTPQVPPVGHLQGIAENLDALRAYNKPELYRYINDHQAKLTALTAKAREIFGNEIET